MANSYRVTTRASIRSLRIFTSCRFLKNLASCRSHSWPFGRARLEGDAARHRLGSGAPLIVDPVRAVRIEAQRDVVVRRGEFDEDKRAVSRGDRGVCRAQQSFPSI